VRERQRAKAEKEGYMRPSARDLESVRRAFESLPSPRVNDWPDSAQLCDLPTAAWRRIALLVGDMNAVRSICRQSWRALHVWHLDEPIGYLLGLLMQRALLGKPRALGLLEQATLRLCPFVPRDMVSADRIEAIKRIQRWRLGRPLEPLPEEGSNVFLGPHPAKRYAHLVLHELAAKHASAFVRDVRPSLPEGSIERKRVEWR
jgi:hypothetical protein